MASLVAGSSSSSGNRLKAEAAQAKQGTPFSPTPLLLLSHYPFSASLNVCSSLQSPSRSLFLFLSRCPRQFKLLTCMLCHSMAKFSSVSQTSVPNELFTSTRTCITFYACHTLPRRRTRHKYSLDICIKRDATISLCHLHCISRPTLARRGN